ncbi:MAG: cyclase family protein [Chloroflexota bacterium]
MKGRLVDLSYTIHPGKEQRKFAVEMIKANQVANVPVLPGQWYIMHNVNTVSHIGTHIEVPYHINQNGADTAGVPLERLVGEAVVLDLRGLTATAEVLLARMRAAAEKAGGVRRGDLVLLHTGWDRYWDQPEYATPPYISPTAMEWLVGEGAALVGIDTEGAEVPGSEQHVNHHIMLDKGVPHIENLRNLDALTKSRVFLFAAPVAIEGMESFPLRVVAIEDED